MSVETLKVKIDDCKLELSELEGQRKDIEARVESVKYVVLQLENQLAELSRTTYPQKTLEDQVNTINTFGFGIENYKIVNDQYIRIKGK